jgi:hypothetical protein
VIERIPPQGTPFSEWHVKELLSALDVSILNLRLAREMLRSHLAQQRELEAARRVCDAIEGWLTEAVGRGGVTTPLREAVAAYRAVRTAVATLEGHRGRLPEPPRGAVAARALPRREIEKLARG